MASRPGCFEPRRRQRRPVKYSLLQRPSAWHRRHGDSGARSLRAIRDIADLLIRGGSTEPGAMLRRGRLRPCEYRSFGRPRLSLPETV